MLAPVLVPEEDDDDLPGACMCICYVCMRVCVGMCGCVDDDNDDLPVVCMCICYVCMRVCVCVCMWVCR